MASRVPASPALLLTSILALLAVPACGDDGTSDSSGTDGDTGDGDVYGPSYASCAEVGDPTCSGVDCAADPDAEHWLELVEAEITARGWSDRVFVTSAASMGNNTVGFELMSEVGWYRTWAPLPSFGGLPTDEGDLTFTVLVGNFLDELDLPSAVIDFETVEQAFADCDPSLVYDPCRSNGWNFDIYENVTYMPEPNCQEDAVTLRIDVITGEITCDTDPPEVGCG